MTRTDILNTLIKRYGYKTYLEIGVEEGKNFKKINLPIEDKVGVDPVKRCDGVTVFASDDFFAQNKNKFDLIFIDGLHHADQVQRDILNSLSALAPGGTIMCHDMSPKTELDQVVPRPRDHWNGDCWKAWVRLRQELSDVEMFVIDTDYGCGVIRRGMQIPIAPLRDADLTWTNLVWNRKLWLNMVSEQEFLDKLKRPEEAVVAEDQSSMKTVCLTPTGDRPQMLDLARKWFERSRKIGKVDWMVVDDGVTPYNPGGCIYIRREPDGENSLGRQLSCALPMCNEYDNILIWEDDDYYMPGRIAAQIDFLSRNEKPLHGWGRGFYYHLGFNGYYEHHNTAHASLCETGFRREFILNVLECIGRINDMFYDLEIWKRYGNKFGTISLGNRQTIGIKGGPGRNGIGKGHDSVAMSYRKKPLHELIGDDASEYERIMAASKSV